MKSQVLATALVFALAGLMCAQESSTIAPCHAPIGCNIMITIANDTVNTTGTGACFYTVQDASGNYVYNPAFCILVWITITPGATHTQAWPQVDDYGNQLPAGAYTVNVRLPNGIIEPHPLVIGGVDAGIGELGGQRPGVTRGLYVCSPGHGSETFAVVAAFNPGAIQVPGCGGTRVFPLTIDNLWVLSTSPNNGIFNAMAGVLDTLGESVAPNVTIPASVMGVSGLSYYVAAVSVDASQPCVVTSVTAACQVVFP